MNEDMNNKYQCRVCDWTPAENEPDGGWGTAQTVCPVFMWMKNRAIACHAVTA